MSRREDADRQAFWSLVLGLPVLILVVRLSILARGDLQTTLLLVSNVGPVNLLAAVMVTAAWFVPTAAVAVFAIVGLTRAGLLAEAEAPWWRRLLAAASRAPRWIVVAAFAAAAVTWQLVFVPMLFMAYCVSFGLRPARNAKASLRWIVASVAYLVVFAPAGYEAALDGSWLLVLLLTGPPVLIGAGVGRPLPQDAAAPLIPLLAGVAGVLLLAGMLPAASAPVLPLSVITVDPGAGQAPVLLRGNVVETNDATTAVLLDDGGVRFVRSDSVVSRVLCPDSDQVPRWRVSVYGIQIEDSVIRGIGYANRPVHAISARCRSIRTSET
jgi:hypothetical protein